MKNKKSLIIMIPLILIVIFAVYLVRNSSDGNKEPSEGTFTLLSDYNEFFGINKLVNDYIDSNDTGSMNNYYYANKVYRVVFNNNKYYLVTGDKVSYDYKTSKMTMTSNDDYLINVYLNNNRYEIENIDDINNYIDSNKLYDNVKINNKNYFDDYKIYKVDNRTIVVNYIGYFKDLLFANYTKAYSMLDDSYKNKVGSIENFNSIREELYNNIIDNYTDYSIKGDDASRTYHLVLDNKYELIFIEKHIMDFTFNINKVG